VDAQHSDAPALELPCACGKRLKIPKTHVRRPALCPGCRRTLSVVAHGDLPDTRGGRGMLVVQYGPQRVGEQVFLAGRTPIEVGKQPGSDLQLTSAEVSRRHCRLVPTPSGWSVVDCQSTNGLHVNGRRVTEHPLVDGDRIRIGDYELVYSGGGDRPGSPSVPTPKPAPPSRAAAVAKPPPAPRRPPPVKPPAPDDDEGTYALADDLTAFADAEGSRAAEDSRALGARSTAAEGGLSCPCCKMPMPPGSKICVACGINLKTGRSILTVEDTSLDELYVAAEGLIRVLSWVVFFGIYPIASEAFGTRKPYATRAIALLTVITSVWFFVDLMSSPEHLRETKNYMLWAGDAELPAEELASAYEDTPFGDTEAFNAKCAELSKGNPTLSEGKLAAAAHTALLPEQQCVGQYHTYQLVTHAFVHGGIVHLVGNLVFLLVFGSRVNALIGNLGTLVLYPILAAAAGLAHLMSMHGQLPEPMIGASGAIMGLAGMYLILFPVHQVHMAAWLRLGLITGFRLSLKIWAVRGFWVVLFYIAFDVVYTAAKIQDDTAHWAHLGGFIAGVGIALALLFGRVINGRGADLVSTLLGRHAWGLVGPPNRGPGYLQRLP
jgi:membrane associated rhomboid family serine protease